MTTATATTTSTRNTVNILGVQTPVSKSAAYLDFLGDAISGLNVRAYNYLPMDEVYPAPKPSWDTDNETITLPWVVLDIFYGDWEEDENGNSYCKSYHEHHQIHSICDTEKEAEIDAAYAELLAPNECRNPHHRRVIMENYCVPLWEYEYHMKEKSHA